MTEQSIRDELIDQVATFWAVTDTPEQVADGLLASPVIRRIQAAAWSEGAAWAAVECGAIDHETEQFEAPGDNPYIEKGVVMSEVLAAYKQNGADDDE